MVLLKLLLSWLKTIGFGLRLKHCLDTHTGPAVGLVDVAFGPALSLTTTGSRSRQGAHLRGMLCAICSSAEQHSNNRSLNAACQDALHPWLRSETRPSSHRESSLIKQRGSASGQRRPIRKEKQGDIGKGWEEKVVMKVWRKSVESTEERLWNRNSEMNYSKGNEGRFGPL